MPRPARTYKLSLVGHYLGFEDGAPVRKVWREEVDQTGPINARALRIDLCKSFLSGGHNEVVLGENAVPHISFLQVVNPANRAVMDTDRAPMFEVI